MSRLRHPVRAIREPFGTAGLIIAVIALIAALGGTALAAKGALTGTQKKEVEKIAKKYAGKPGASGANGTNGTNGAGGKEGQEGKAGTNGTNGTNGTTGKSVIVTNEAPANCGEGGVTYEVEGSGSENEVCNGEEGVPGPPGATGSPWPGGGTLTKGATEKGTWAVVPFETAFGFKAGVDPVSFVVPLPAAPTLVRVTQEEEEGTVSKSHTVECPGTLSEPKAAEGHLCLYTQSEFEQTDNGSSTFAAGALLKFTGELEGVPIGGTWAVTAG